MCQIALLNLNDARDDRHPPISFSVTSLPAMRAGRWFPPALEFHRHHPERREIPGLDLEIPQHRYECNRDDVNQYCQENPDSRKIEEAILTRAVDHHAGGFERGNE